MTALNRRHKRLKDDKKGTTYEATAAKVSPDASEFNELLPYGGNVYLGRTKKPDGWMCIAALFVCLFVCVGLLYACYFHFHAFHYHVTHAYAKLGHVHAQHVVGERLLHGKGVEKNEVR